LYDVLRVDHFRGFESYWAVPYGNKTAKIGRWRPGPGMDLVGVLKNWFPGLSFIAEDLGYTTPEVEKLLADSGFCKLKDTGEIKNYYPPLGFNPDLVRNCVLLGLLAGIVASICIVTCSVTSSKKTPATDDFDPIALTSDEQKNAVQDDLGGSYVDDYILDDKQINKSYEDAIKLFKAKRENAALVEINRLTYSNASSSIKVKASNLKEQLFKDPKTHADRDPEFSTLRDNYSWEDVVDKNTGGLKNLFRDCYVVWVGKIANIETSPDGSWKCTLLVYNKEFNKFFGYLTVNFDSAQPSVNEENPIAILGRLRPEGGKFCMDGRVVFQSIKNSDLYELLSKLNL
ncbi:MAG: 4-alpha-glucanotransferase, partial [Treponema sp.]|nr:4-alpha-glucanotransferase [Treponema sp.]